MESGPFRNSSDIQRKNRRVAVAVFAVVLCMVAMSFAAVPLYNLFCRVTGYGGTTQVAAALPDKMSTRVITVNFNADISPELAWEFKPEQRRIDVRLGQKGLASYRAANLTNKPLTGTAVYNVSPPKAGKYFHKIECFCFGEQTLGPGRTASMPVMFYVDPAMEEDPSMDDVSVITLSYTFYKAQTRRLEEAMEAFYNQGPAASGAQAADQSDKGV